MNKKFFLIVVSFIFILVVGSIGWGAPAGKEPIKIGFIGALSAPYGISNKHSLEISIEELNKAGGILGRPVQLVVQDWKREVPLAVAAYKKLVISEKCLLVFTEGSEGTNACMQEGSALYKEFPHIVFAFWTAADSITDQICSNYEKYKFAFRFYKKAGSDTVDPRLKFWEVFTEVIKTKKLALIFEEMAWSEPIVKGIPGKILPIKEFMESKGLKVVYSAKHSINEKMFLPFFEKIVASGADTVYWGVGYSDAVLLAKQWAVSAGKDVDIIGESGIGSYAAFYNMTGGAALGYMADSPEIAIPFTEYSLPFLKELKRRGGGLTASTPGAYDGPWVLKTAVEKLGNSQDVEGLIKTIEGIEVQRGFWKWKFDKCHDPVKGYPYFPMIKGQFQEDGNYRVIFSDDVRKLANPTKKFIRAKELREKAGRK
jgi:branched-chain amino acid transport system substrate-binding protein